MDDAFSNLITTYHELNPAVVDELDQEPSPLEFMRYVAKNRPFVVRQAAADWKAVRDWDGPYLRSTMADKEVKVAMTPLGNADGVLEREDDSLLFIEPHETSEDFGSFLDYVQEEATISDSEKIGRNVKYAQTQNDNLRDEYESLFADCPADIAFARITLQQSADAVNMWVGNQRSVTAMHMDNYENIYVQVRGQKHFVLLPPCAMPGVNETMLAQASYRPASESEGGKLVAQMKEGEESIPVAVWDPDQPRERTTAYSKLLQPIRVTLDEGDMLYLPAMWYHKVSQSAGREGFACSVNYWYDMEFAGGFWAGNQFVKEALGQQDRAVSYPTLDMEGET